MAYHTVEGEWTELKGKIKMKFAKLTDDDIESVKGNLLQLTGKIQKAYGLAKEEAERQFQEFRGNYKDKVDQFVSQVSNQVNSKIDKVNHKLDKVNKRMAKH